MLTIEVSEEYAAANFAKLLARVWNGEIIRIRLNDGQTAEWKLLGLATS